MIELLNDALCFHFPEVHPDARLEVSFIRTLRIPDDGSPHPLRGWGMLVQDIALAPMAWRPGTPA